MDSLTISPAPNNLSLDGGPLHGISDQTGETFSPLQLPDAVLDEFHLEADGDEGPVWVTAPTASLEDSATATLWWALLDGPFSHALLHDLFVKIDPAFWGQMRKLGYHRAEVWQAVNALCAAGRIELRVEKPLDGKTPPVTLLFVDERHFDTLATAVDTARAHARTRWQAWDQAHAQAWAQAVAQVADPHDVAAMIRAQALLLQATPQTREG